MPKSSEFHIGADHVSGQIRSPALSGQTGSPSSSADTYHSRVMSTPLSSCDSEIFDCPNEEEEEEDEMNESLLRRFIRQLLLRENSLSLGHSPTATSSTPNLSVSSSGGGSITFGTKTEDEDDIIDEDELEEEDEVDEINAIGMGGGGGASRGTIRGVTLPLGAPPPSHGRKRRTPAEAAGSGFGGAKPYMPGKRKKGKKRKSKK
ncbi:hypothetical protein OAA09_01340 [bacterium]|nr:hypothetical protein [bacterium]